MPPKNNIPDEFFMREALKEAQKALREGEVPIGCVIVSDDQIVGKGHNEVERLNDVTAHAEIIAITAASQFFQSKYLPDCTLYVTIEPCMMCASAIGWAQLGKVVFGAADPKKGFTLFEPSPLHPKTKLKHGVLGDECSTLVKELFKQKRK